MFNYKKIASVLASAVMLSSTIGFAAALNYPAPFVTSGTADAAVVVGLNADISDLNAAIDVGQSLNTLVTAGSGTSAGSSVSGGDSILLAKSSDNLNLGNTWGVFTGTIDDDDLMNLLADGTYVADDNDEFGFEQKISIGSPTLTHFRDSDYETQLRAQEDDDSAIADRTPILGFKIGSSQHIMNYTLDFTQDAESTVTSGDLDDFEGSDLHIMGKTYYVSDAKNGSSTGNLGKLTLLDSAVVSSVGEGSSTTVNVADKSYAVSIVFIDNDEVVFDINGERAPSSGKLNVGDSFRLVDNSYIGVRDISKLEIAGETGTSSFSIGSGKLELTHGSDIKLNDDSVNGIKVFMPKGTYNSPDVKLSKIVIEWKTDEEVFLSPDIDLVMPGFSAVKLTMGDIQRNSEEKISVEPDGDNSIEMTLPIKDGTVSFNLLYGSGGAYTAIGKASDERLATSNGSTLTFIDKDSSGNDYHSWFVATYNTTSEGESYLLRAKVTEDASNGRNETTVEKNVDGSWVTVCEDKVATDTCDIGDVSLTVTSIIYQDTSTSGENVTFTAGSGVTFHNIYTAGGLRFSLPYIGANSTTPANGEINFSANTGLGHNASSWYLFGYPENKDDDLGIGTGISVTLDDSSDKMHIASVNVSGGGPGTGSGGVGALEKGSGTNIHENYVNDDVATRTLHYTNPDEDYVEIYYPSGKSETYAEVFLAETGASITPGATGGTVGEGGQVLIVKDSEMSSVAGKNLVVVGGSCINTAAAKILNSDSPLCGSAFTDSTGVGAGQYIIKTVTSPWANDKVAMLVAGYEAADTVNAVRRAMEGASSDVGSESIYPIAG
jgi:hypothetical protein